MKQPEATLEELPPVLTMKDLRRYLAISRPKAYELVHQKGFPTVRLGRSIRIPRAAFAQWLENQTRGEE